MSDPATPAADEPVRRRRGRPRKGESDARDRILAAKAEGRPGFLLGDLTGLGKTLSAWLAISAMPEREVLVARDGKDVADHLMRLTPERARAIGAAARRRIVNDHTYSQRAVLVDELFRSELAAKG